MTFITGTVTNSAPGPALHALMEPALTAAGLTLVDTVVIGARTHKVWKSPAAGNDRNLDWFLDISYPTTGTGSRLMMAPFEDYNAATDLAFRGPKSINDVNIDATTFSRYGDTGYALETNWVNSASYTNIGTVLSASAMAYWFTVTGNRAILMTSSDGGAAYAGFFTPTQAHIDQAGAALFPLIMCKLNSTGSVGGSTSASSVLCAVTRFPRYSASDFNSFTQNSYGWACVSVDGDYVPNVLGGGIAGAWSHPSTGGMSGVELPVIFGSYSGYTYIRSARVGSLDGLAKGLVSSSAVRGDYITIAGEDWYVSTPSSNQALLIQAV